MLELEDVPEIKPYSQIWLNNFLVGLDGVWLAAAALFAEAVLKQGTMQLCASLPDIIMLSATL